MKFQEPKSKTGKPMLDVTISYYANNRASSRWFLNGVSAPLPKIAELLGYSSVSQFKLSVKQYGVALVLSKGLAKLREERFNAK